MPLEVLHGFAVEPVELPAPTFPVSEECRARLVRVAAAMLAGATPEAIAGYLTNGFPGEIDEALARPFEAEELDAFVDVLLFVTQASG